MAKKVATPVVPTLQDLVNEEKKALLERAQAALLVKKAEYADWVKELDAVKKDQGEAAMAMSSESQARELEINTARKAINAMWKDLNVSAIKYVPASIIGAEELTDRVNTLESLKEAELQKAIALADEAHNAKLNAAKARSDSLKITYGEINGYVIEAFNAVKEIESWINKLAPQTAATVPATSI